MKVVSFAVTKCNGQIGHLVTALLHLIATRYLYANLNFVNIKYLPTFGIT